MSTLFTFDSGGLILSSALLNPQNLLPYFLDLNGSKSSRSGGGVSRSGQSAPRQSWGRSKRATAAGHELQL